MLRDAYESWLERRINLVEELLEHDADEVTQDMKASAEWVDDTGRARRSLRAWVEVERGHDGAVATFTYTLAYDDPEVDYGESLEYDHGGRYSIVRPTAQIVRRRIPAMIADRLGRT